MTTALGSQDVRPDVIVTFNTSWNSAAARDFSYSEDRLAVALLSHGRVRKVLVCEPFRSAPRKIARRLLGGRDASFPTSPTVAHHAPLRPWRPGPIRPAEVQRLYTAYERSIRRAAKRLGLVSPVVITADPLLAGFGEFDWAGPVTYYGWDDWTAFEPRRHHWDAYDAAFARLRLKRRSVVAVSDEVAARIAPTGRCVVVPNGIDPAEWSRLQPAPDWFTARPVPRLLYVGSLQSRIDTEQLRRLALAFPSGSLTLVGTIWDPAHFESLRDIPNVMFHPQLPRSAIPGIIGAADVGLIPHLLSRFTAAISRPLKLYEYLAAGAPVVAHETAPGLTGLSDRVIAVPPGGDMVPAVRRALAFPPQPEAERHAFVQEHSWDRRIEALLDVALASQ